MLKNYHKLTDNKYILKNVRQMNYLDDVYLPNMVLKIYYVNNYCT